MSKPLFFIMGHPSMEESHSVVEDINACMATAKNFKKAYEMALFLGKIQEPDLTYRQALTRYKDSEHVYINCKKNPSPPGSDGKVLITRINLY